MQQRIDWLIGLSCLFGFLVEPDEQNKPNEPEKPG